MAKTTLLIGSIQNLADQDLTIDGNAETLSASAAGIYLDHQTGSLSAFTQLETAMTAAGLTNPYVRFNENLLVELGADGGNFPLVWDDDEFRDFLGFDGDLSGDNPYEAPNLSKFIWAPGVTEAPLDDVLGGVGIPMHDALASVAPDGTQVVTRFGEQQLNRWRWRYVQKARFRTTSELGGEFVEFFNEVLVRGSKFLMFREIEEDSSSSSALTITLSDALGPLELDVAKAGNRVQLTRESGFENVEGYYRVQFPTIAVPEYS